MIDKYERLTEWLKEYPTLYSWVGFNAVQMFPGNTSINSVPNQRKIKEYIDGSYESALVFSIGMVTLYDTEASRTNYEAMNEVQNLMQWIEDNPKTPDFGQSYTIHGVEVTTDTPTLIVDPDDNLARYDFTARVEYLFDNSKEMLNNE